MSFTTPLYSAVRATILADWQSLNPSVAVTSDSDNYIRASGFASAVEGLYQYQQWGVRQQFADSADSVYLEHHCAMRGMGRKPAVVATGTLRVTGTSGSVMPAQTSFTVGAVEYVTTTAATVPVGGAIDVLAEALIAGVAGNQSENSAATLTSAPAGINTAAILLTMGSGADGESDASLLGRYLDLLRQPPRGGSEADWKRWAEEVPGVQKAYVYPLRSGLGTVDVCITSSSGVPSAQLIQAVIDHIDPLRPVDMAAYNIVAPTPQNVPVSAQVTLANGYALVSVTAVINTVLATYFANLAPGESAIRSRIESLISEVDGVLDRTVSLPTGNVTPTVNASQIGWAVLGAVSVT